MNREHDLEVVTLKGPLRARDVGGAGLEDTIPQPAGPEVWIVCALPPDGGIYLSLHATEAGANARLGELAAEWGVPLDKVEGTVSACEVETP